MKIGGVLRIAMGVALAAVFVLVLGALLLLTDSALSIWQRLLEGPAVLRYLFVAVLAGAVVSFGWLTFKLLVPRRDVSPAAKPAVLDEAELQRKLAEAQASGIEAREARQEIERLNQHRQGGDLSLALFGQVSTGKSSLAKALLPDADVLISPLAGSTADIARYQWQAKTGATITLADLPGLEAVGKSLDSQMLDEARRAHAVVSVTDGDMTRQQGDALTRLRELNKPLIVTLNKADRYAEQELGQLLRRIQQRLGNANDGVDRLSPALVVTIAGGEQEVVKQDEDGSERGEARAREPDVSQLVMALDELLGRDLAGINALREQALLPLAAEKLDQAEQRYREQRAEQIVRAATRRAVVGALAAVTPGTDIVIQGYLGTTMTRELCGLYGQQPRDIEVEKFLDLSQSRVGKVLPVSLAIAGNGLKAFPGVGTIAGGLVHAVAYGLIFDAVGRGLARSLADDAELSPAAAAAAVEKDKQEYLEQGGRRVAKIAIEQSSRDGRD